MKKYIAAAGIILVFCILAGVIIWKAFLPGYKMPAIAFAYHGSYGYIYLFASSGDIYRIDPADYGESPYARHAQAMTALENGRTEEWLKPYGKVSVTELKKQYRAFRKITDNPDFIVFPTEEAIPDVIPNGSYMKPSEMWYGYTENHEMRTMFLKGYLGYKASDERIGKVVSWICEMTRTVRKDT